MANTQIGIHMESCREEGAVGPDERDGSLAVGELEGGADARVDEAVGPAGG